MSHSETYLLTCKESGYRLSMETANTQGREEAEMEHELTSCQTVRCFSTSAGRFPKLSGNISDRSMISSHPWSDNQVQGLVRLLFSREMFPNNNRRDVISWHQHTRKCKHLYPGTSLTLGGKFTSQNGLEREGGIGFLVTVRDSSQEALSGFQSQGSLKAEPGCSKLTWTISEAGIVNWDIY